jgi:hypothetical protein
VAKSQGYLGTLEISTDGGSNYSVVGSLTDISRKPKRATMDTSNHDDAGTNSHIAGRKSYDMSAKGFYDAVDVGQIAMNAAIESGAIVKLRYRPNPGVGNTEYIHSALVTGGDDDSPNAAPNAISYSMQCTGAATIQAQQS